VIELMNEDVVGELGAEIGIVGTVGVEFGLGVVLVVVLGEELLESEIGAGKLGVGGVGGIASS
jgi:formate/nitrite transporter FocA (FNT family)